MSSGSASADGLLPSVVVAAHNEAGAIGDVVRKVRDVLGEVELIVVDDGSTDGTADEAEAEGARVIRCWPNQGKGVAMRHGIEAATGRWLVFIDGDGQDDPTEIPALLAAIDDDVALVNGSRFLGVLEPGAIHPVNRVANKSLTGLLSLLYGQRITDSQAGFRVVRADLVRSLSLRSTEYEFETEVLARILRRGLRVVEVPVTRYPRAAGHTDFRRVRNGLRILAMILTERVRPVPMA